MSTLALLDTTSYVHGHDFTTDSNRCMLSMEATALDRTTFGSNGFVELGAGLKHLTHELAGFWQSDTADAVDPEAFNDLGVRNRVHTVAPVGDEASVAYLFQAGKFNYQLLGTINEMAPFTLNSVNTDGVGAVRGQLAKAKGSVSATGVLGSPVNLGAGGAGKFLYASLHVFSVGTTITVAVQSDTASNFPSPTTVATFTAQTARGGVWLPRVDASAITDTWYRLNVTAVTGTFVVAGAIAVQ